MFGWFVRNLDSHISAPIRPSHFGTAVAGGLVALLLALAASANAETADPATAAVAQATEGVAPVQSTPPSTTAAADPVDAAEPVETVTPPPISPELNPAEDLPAGNPPETTAARSVAAPRAPTEVIAPGRADIGVTSPSTRQVTEAVGVAREDVAMDVAMVVTPVMRSAETVVTHSAEAVARSVDAATPVDRVRSLARSPLQRVSRALTDVSSDPPDGKAIEVLRLREGSPQAGGGRILPSAVPSLPGSPAAIVQPLRRVVVLAGVARHYLEEFEGSELLRREPPSVTNDPRRTTPRASTRVALGSFGTRERSLNLAPLENDSPSPFPGPPKAAASGSSGSSFVPIAALLALLALAVPAILRRLREVPDLPAPTLFVCALERPG
jgi:hypothetical protein